MVGETLRDSHLLQVGASPVAKPLDPHGHPTESFRKIFAMVA
jgi:hypothetical protein